MIRNIRDLAHYLGVPSCFEGDWVAAVRRAVYKYSDCGCVFDVCDIGSEVYISGYAEGADAECPRHTLVFPFSEERWDDTFALADEEGCELWHEWNENELYYGEYDDMQDIIDDDNRERARDMNETLRGGW